MRITPINVHMNDSVHRSFLKLGLGWNSGLQNEIMANKRLSHGMRNYGIEFVVNGIRSKLATFSAVECGKHSHQQRVFSLIEQQSL